MHRSLQTARTRHRNRKTKCVASQQNLGHFDKRHVQSAPTVSGRRFSPAEGQPAVDGVADFEAFERRDIKLTVPERAAEDCNGQSETRPPYLKRSAAHQGLRSNGLVRQTAIILAFFTTILNQAVGAIEARPDHHFAQLKEREQSAHSAATAAERHAFYVRKSFSLGSNYRFQHPPTVISKVNFLSEAQCCTRPVAEAAF